MKRHLMTCAVLGVLGISCAIQAAASTVALSTGTAAYTIASDTNTNGSTITEGTTVNVVTKLAGGWLANPITDGIGDSGVWIAPEADMSNAGKYGNTNIGGTTVYDLSFSLAGLDPTTALLTMNLTADDYVDVTLNGTTIFTHTSTEMWTAAAGVFTVNDTGSIFNGGTNTLVFTVPNNPNDGAASCCGPTGLDVAASVSASPIVTPEPSKVWPLGGAVLLAAFLLRKRLRPTASTQ